MILILEGTVPRDRRGAHLSLPPPPMVMSLSDREGTCFLCTPIQNAHRGLQFQLLLPLLLLHLPDPVSMASAESWSAVADAATPLETDHCTATLAQHPRCAALYVIPMAV